MRSSAIGIWSIVLMPVATILPVLNTTNTILMPFSIVIQLRPMNSSGQ